MLTGVSGGRRASSESRRSSCSVLIDLVPWLTLSTSTPFSVSCRRRRRLEPTKMTVAIVDNIFLRVVTLYIFS